MKAAFVATILWVILQDAGSSRVSVISANCLNGGFHDGNRCVCLPDYYGSLCEFITDRIEIGRSIDTVVEVQLTFINQEFTEELTDNSTVAYKEFENKFKNDMREVYGDIPGYIDVIIRSIRPGSVIVDHDVIIEAAVQENVTVTEQYTEICQRVNQTLTVLRESNCTTDNNLCIGDSTVEISKVPPKTEEDLCSEEVQEGYKEFFTYFIGVNGLECISHCNPDSENFYACSRGTCEIQINVGPHCLCTETNKYIYMDSRCNQRILKTSLFGGVGAAVGVVLIITVTVTVFLLRSLKKRKDNVSSNLEDKDATWFDTTVDRSDKGVVKFHGEESYVQDNDSSKNSLQLSTQPGKHRHEY